MKSFHRHYADDMRMIWAITAKDLLDGFKNKTILISIASVLFIILVYRYLPALDRGNTPPRLVILDQGQSSLPPRLEDNPNFDLRVVSSWTEFNNYLARMDFVVLGLVLPPDFDQHLNSAEISLEGYTIHWAAQAQADEIRVFFEQQLEAIGGIPIRIHIEGNKVYTQANSHGLAFLAAVSLIIALTMFGISTVPNLILQEKLDRTMDAILVSPASKGHIVIAKALTGMIYCLSAALVVFALYWTIITHWWLAILAVICGALLAVALGLLLGSALEEKQQLTLWAWFVLIPLLLPLFLSIVDDLLPDSFMRLIRWIPTVALSRAIRASFSDHTPLTTFGPELALVLGSTFLILMAVVWVLRRSEI